jgi:hypothetical protein
MIHNSADFGISRNKVVVTGLGKSLLSDMMMESERPKVYRVHTPMRSFFGQDRSPRQIKVKSLVAGLAHVPNPHEPPLVRTRVRPPTIFTPRKSAAAGRQSGSGSSLVKELKFRPDSKVIDSKGPRQVSQENKFHSMQHVSPRFHMYPYAAKIFIGSQASVCRPLGGGCNRTR